MEVPIIILLLMFPFAYSKCGSSTTVSNAMKTCRTLCTVGSKAGIEFVFDTSWSDYSVVWKQNSKSLMRHDARSSLILREGWKYTSTLSTSGTRARLGISDATIGDAGSYSCIRYPTIHGVVETKRCYLFLQGPVTVTLHTIPEEHQNMTLECCVTFSELWSSSTISWIFDDGISSLPFGSCVSTESTETSMCSNITFISRRSYHGKNMKCLIRNQVNASSSANIVVLHSASNVRLTSSASKRLFLQEKNDRINLTCSSDGYPTPTFILQQFLSEKGWQNMSTIGNIPEEGLAITKCIFHNVAISQNITVFRCVSCNGYNGWALSGELIIEKPYPALVNVITPHALEIKENEDVLIRCKATGNPTPVVKLQRLSDLYEWQTLQLDAQNQSLNPTVWEFQLQHHKIRDVEEFRCIAQITGRDNAISEIVFVRNEGAEGSTESMVIFICCGIILVMALSMFIKKGVRLCKFYGCSWQLSLSKSAEYDLELDNLHSGTVTTFSQTDMVFSLLLKKGKFRHRWIGIFKKGTDVQTKVILSTAGDYSGCEADWRHVCQMVREMPDNENVVKFLGLCIKSDTVYCVHEHLAYGTVRTLLGNDYGRNMVQGELNGGVAPYYFFRFALCVVRGIKFLHQYHWIHPGLCIDKLLLTANNNSCKLYSFCHSAVKDLEPRADVSTSFVPLYFPPEHIGKRVYTKKSDVWAVGVVVWEIFSYGVLPPTHADVRSRVDVCRNLKKPSRCPDKIYSAVSECWHFNINLRPNLQRLEECLEKAFDDHHIIHSNEAFYDIPQVEVEGGSKCYDNVYDRQIL
ncbi:uncharacterized protein [Apostichopus japonicus]|uniref:uncharacterized protein isoform X1 n=1 Tax=Stichopus japonicus TaxID=307972 RepID=UPI003AB907FE